MADLVEQIKKQVEYYFSESNLRKDQFLKKTSSEHQGWVPLSVLMTFNKLKELTQDPQVVLAALETSDQISISTDRTSLKPAQDYSLENSESEAASSSSKKESDPSSEARTVTIYPFAICATTSPDPHQVSELMAPFGKVLLVSFQKSKRNQGALTGR